MGSFITTVTLIVCASHHSFPQYLCIVICFENIQFSQTMSLITNAPNGSGFKTKTGKSGQNMAFLFKMYSLFQPNMLIGSFRKSYFSGLKKGTLCSCVYIQKPRLLRINSIFPQCLQLFLLIFELAMVESDSSGCNSFKLHKTCHSYVEQDFSLQKQK